MLTEPRAIIFDFNGVIVDDEPLHLELFQRVLAEVQITLTEADYRERYLGHDDRGCFSAVLRDAGRAEEAADRALIERLIARKNERYLQAIDDRCQFFPGAIEIARRLSGRLPLAIASGALRSEIEHVLDLGGIRGCFTAIIAAEDVSTGKPDPACYQKALSALNAAAPGGAPIHPEECMVIEDSRAGIEAAHRAGMRCLAITNSHGSGELGGADWIAASLSGCEPEALFIGEEDNHGSNE